MKKLLLLLFLFTGISAFAQIHFEDGYYITNSGEKIPVLIRYVDWKNNPSEVSFKRTAEGQISTLPLENVAEFGVDAKAKYVRATVPIDISNVRLKDLSNNGQIEVKEETVFLKTVIDGEADLFLFQNGVKRLFFFRNGNEEIKPLYYKRYVPEGSVKFAENNQFRQQLYNSLSCDQLESKDFEDTNYNKKDFVKLFTVYNNCKTGTSSSFTEEENKDTFHLSVKAGVRFSSLTMETFVVNRSIDFGNNTGLTLGLEAEYIMPFFRNKWAFIAAPTYQSYEADAVFPEERYEDGSISVTYHSVELPLGVRHYFFLNDENKIFLNGSVTIDLLVGENGFKVNATADTYDEIEISTNTATNLSFGGGYSYKNFSLEARYNLGRSLTGKSLSIGSTYNSFDLVFGYRFF